MQICVILCCQATTSGGTRHGKNCELACRLAALLPWLCSLWHLAWCMSGVLGNSAVLSLIEKSHNSEHRNPQKSWGTFRLHFAIDSQRIKQSRPGYRNGSTSKSLRLKFELQMCTLVSCLNGNVCSDCQECILTKAPHNMLDSKTFSIFQKSCITFHVPTVSCR